MQHLMLTSFHLESRATMLQLVASEVIKEAQQLNQMGFTAFARILLSEK